MKRFLIRFIAILGLVVAAHGCRKPAEQPQPPAVEVEKSDTVPIVIGRETFNLEIADSTDEHRRGLMYRESMPQDHGMIFVFDAEDERAFWMEATLIPLDILYVDSTGKIVSIKSMKPRDRTPVPSGGAAKYAIELNAGAAARAAINPGDVLSIPPQILALKGSK